MRLVPTPQLIELMRHAYPSGGWMAIQPDHPDLTPKQINSLANRLGMQLNEDGRRAATLRRAATIKSRVSQRVTKPQQQAPRRYADWSKPDSGINSPGTPRRFPSVWHLAQGIAA